MALNLTINKYRQNFIFAATFFILIFLICPVALCVLPPEVYKKAIHSSDIKALAIVEKVEILDETNRSTFKKVLFKLEKSFTSGFPPQKRYPGNSAVYAIQLIINGKTRVLAEPFIFIPEKEQRF